jgi:hypothetical protein
MDSIFKTRAKLINEENTFLQVTERQLQWETESCIIYVQDQALNTRYAKEILKTADDSISRMCQDFMRQ